MNVYFSDRDSLRLYRRDGHLNLQMRAIYAGGDIEGESFWFILDTGAFLTVISRIRAEQFGFDKLPKIASKIKGFTGETPADFVRIPSLKIIDKLITDVPVLIPHKRDLEQNILGLNILEYFNYYIDTENDRMYLNLNPNPRHYDPILACGQVFTIQAGE